LSTIKDVAKKAHVGISTVSRYYNDPSKVQLHTRALIEQAIKDLDFTPSTMARSFRVNKTKIIALLIPSVIVPFYANLAYYIEEECDARGYKTLLCITNGNEDKEVYFLSLIKESRVDGIIALTYFNLDKYLKTEVPIVTFDHTFNGKITTISSDNYQGGIFAAERLEAIKCKNIAYVGTFENIKNTSIVKRREGFIDYCLSHNITYSDIRLQDPIVDYYLLAKTFFDQYWDIDGVFAENDDIAMYLVKEALSRGKKIPQDFNVIGFDGVMNSFYNILQLSTIVQPLSKIASTLVSSLIGIMEKKESPKDIVLSVELRLGETTRRVLKN
jgi:LacI family transcriptional regulator